MTLSEFIPRVLGFAEKTEKQLDGLAKAQADAVELKAANAKLQTSLTEAQGQVATITIEVDAARATIAQQASEITTLKASVETEKRRANEVIASQGLDPSRLPSGSVTTPTGTQKPKTVTEECIAAKKATLPQ
jgi:uncharacterized phage infection (PIP) family protein YhgE